MRDFRIQRRILNPGDSDKKYVFGRRSGAPTFPFGWSEFHEIQPQEVWLCEGWADALALRALLDEHTATLGLPGKQSWRSEWAEAFQGKHVYLALDADAKKQAGRIWSDLEGIAAGVEPRKPNVIGDWCDQLQAIRKEAS